MSLCVNFMFLLLSIDWIFSPEVRSLKCKCLLTFGPEIIPKCFRCLVWFRSILKMNFNMQAQLKHTFLFTQHSTRWQPPGRPCLAITFSQPYDYRRDTCAVAGCNGPTQWTGDLTTEFPQWKAFQLDERNAA